jgi:hypothetical protein
MQHSFSLEISDLEPIESGVEQEITLEEAEKIVGGSTLKRSDEDTKRPQHPLPPKLNPLYD